MPWWKAKCSKPRKGRNPQLEEMFHESFTECSKPRKGRNPQRVQGYSQRGGKCSKPRKGRNPQLLNEMGTIVTEV